MLAEELERFLAGKPIHARPLSAPVRAWRWCRRRPVVAGLLAFAVLSLVTGTCVSIYFALEAQKQARDALEKLRDSYYAQARAMRWSGRAGRRFDSLEALTRAAEILPGDDLRDEAIAAMTLADLRQHFPEVQVPADVELVAVDAEFQRFAYGTEQGAVKVCRASDGSAIMTIPGEGAATEFVLKFSPGGNELAVGYADGKIRLWKVNGKQPELLLSDGYRRFAADFDAKGRYLAIAPTDRQVVVHDLQTNTSEQFPIGVRPHSLEFDLKSDRLAVSSVDSRFVEVYQVKGGSLFARLPHQSGTRGMAWHPDGDLLATCCSDSQVYVWDLSTSDSERTPRKLQGHSAVVSRVVFNGAGDLLASNSWDGGLILWDLTSDEPLIQISAAGVPDVLEFSRNDRYLGPRLVAHRLSFWEVAPGYELRTLRDPQGARLWSVAFSQDERLFATARDSGLDIWRTSTGRKLASLPIDSARSVFFLPRRNALLTWGQNGLLLWPLTPGEVNSTEPSLGVGPARKLGVEASRSPEWASIDAAARYVAIADRGAATVRVYDLDEGEITMHRPFANPSSIAISPNGKWVACGTWRAQRETVRVWKVETQEMVSEMTCPPGAIVAFSSDSSKLIFNSGDLSYGVWETESWKPDAHLSREGPGGIGIAFSKNGGFLALGLSAQRARLADVQTQQPLANLLSGRPLMLSDSGDWLLTHRPDQSLELWDLARIRRRLRELKLDWNSILPPNSDPGSQ